MHSGPIFMCCIFFNLQLPSITAPSHMALKEMEHSSVMSVSAQDQTWRWAIYEKAYYLKLSQYGRLFSKIQGTDGY